LTDSAETFLDTNILIYAALGKVDAADKYEIAVGLLTTSFGTSAQVLAEFYTNAKKKGARPLTQDEAWEWVSLLSRKPCQAIDSEIVRSGIEHSVRHQISYRDGAIIAAAERLGARTIYSEDLSHGQTYGDVKVVNPFLGGMNS